VNLSKYSSGVQRFAVHNRWLFSGMITGALLKKPLTAAMVRTTVAPTMIQGSDKSNIIPLKVEAVINIRILQGDTVESVLQTIKKTVNDPRVTVKVEEDSRNPSPVTKTPSVFYYLIADTAKQLFPNADFTPYLVMGGTDARHYTPLTDQALRFMPIAVDKAMLKGLHGDDELVPVETFKKAVHFYYNFFRNADTLGKAL
jgi:carboxypeptidase PM20D1